MVAKQKRDSQAVVAGDFAGFFLGGSLIETMFLWRFFADNLETMIIFTKNIIAVHNF